MTTAPPPNEDAVQAKQEDHDNLLAEKATLVNTQSVEPSSKASSFKDAEEAPHPKSEPEAQKTEPEAPTGPITVPFTHPLPQCKPAPQTELTTEQAKKYEDLLALVNTWTEIPTASGRNPPKEPITDEERLWLTRECLLRYLRASKWSPTEAPKRLLATLT